jgi:hypothetical protein
MAGSVNKVILVGNLGADPEIRSLGSGDRVANLRIATSESWRDRTSGERKEKTEWHRVVIFNDNLVKVAEQYLKKGSTVYIEGAIQTVQGLAQGGWRERLTGRGAPSLRCSRQRSPSRSRRWTWARLAITERWTRRKLAGSWVARPSRRAACSRLRPPTSRSST